MKKSFKFGKMNIKGDIIVKLVATVLICGIIFYCAKIITSQIAKILGAGAAAAGSLAKSFSACLDCTNSTDINGKPIDPKKACPPTGVPFANNDCGGLLGSIAAGIIAFLAFTFALLGIKRFWQSKTAEAAQVHGNISNEDLVKITKPATDEFNEDVKNNGDDIGNSYRDAQEVEQFKDKWNKDNPTDKFTGKSKGDLDTFTSSRTDAKTLQTELRSTIDKTYTNEKIFDTLIQIKAQNAIIKNAPPTTTPEQKAAMDAQFKSDTAAQGAAAATEAGLEGDAAARVDSEAKDPTAAEDDRAPFERACE